MTEIEYIRATNRVKASMALTILRDVLPGEDYMVGKEEFREILSRLQAIEGRLFASLTTNAPDSESRCLRCNTICRIKNGTVCQKCGGIVRSSNIETN